MKHQVLFSLKNNVKIFMIVVCCSRDWRFKSKCSLQISQILGMKVFFLFCHRSLWFTLGCHYNSHSTLSLIKFHYTFDGLIRKLKLSSGIDPVGSTFKEKDLLS